ncbi:metallopeptidase family protein [Humidisolicoccus flavus]|uniref:metallopeptidase family protein n=1 Tax=Humidisolicoccus flavus TaxID=3111414 RepID=UPI0032430F2C
MLHGRETRRSRHGRGIRSSLAGPGLPMLESRETRFEDAVVDAADYLKRLWPEELAQTSFEVADMPPSFAADTVRVVPRWATDRGTRRIVLFRLPIQRMTRLHRNDEWHRRIAIEGCVFKAAAEYIGRDPWEVAPDRFRHDHD